MQTFKQRLAAMVAEGKTHEQIATYAAARWHLPGWVAAMNEPGITASFVGKGLALSDEEFAAIRAKL